MSAKHPVVSITGSSGAGTSTVTRSFQHIFRREQINAVTIEGDAEAAGQRPPTHFGPEANLLDELQNLFKTYGETGGGKRRYYVHDHEESQVRGVAPGKFTEWENLPGGSDVLFYEGLHGGYKDDAVDVSRYADLLVGVVPIVNLEWIQKIHRDMKARGYSLEAVTHTILRRMHDYVHHITPQFSRTHINFQRVAVVDTSNPFVARDIPTLDESLVVIRYRDPHGVDFPYLLNMIHDSFMSRPNCLVVPGGKMELAIQLVLTPQILQLIDRKKKA